MSPLPPRAVFDKAMLRACSPELQRQIEQEVRLLACEFVPSGEPLLLEAAADALDESVEGLPDGRRHVRLWAAGFRGLARNKG